jgi:hypothetical protein
MTARCAWLLIAALIELGPESKHRQEILALLLAHAESRE